jgi:hypothetical protein
MEVPAYPFLLNRGAALVIMTSFVFSAFVTM